MGVAVLALLSIGASVCDGQEPDWARRQPLPAPNGTYAVGTLPLRLDDWSRPTSRHIASRSLRVQVWYPSRSSSSGPRAKYIAERGLVDSMISRGYLDVTRDEMQSWDSVKLVARLKAIPAKPPTASGWPVLVFSHGMGASRVSYASYLQQLASHGYVVLAIDHPMGGFTLGPEGQVLTPGVDSVPYPYPFVLGPLVSDWAKDASFVVRTVQADLGSSSAHGLRIPLDTTRVGMLGHSLGGAAALQACHAESLFVACADMDGDTFGEVDSTGVGKPFLTLLSQPDFKGEPVDSVGRAARERMHQMGRERDSSWIATIAKQPGVAAYVLKIRGTAHMSFSDAPFLFPSQMQGTSSTLERVKAFRVISDRLVEFFDHYLKGSRLKTLKQGMSP
jgi:dienelactone hydrolase